MSHPELSRRDNSFPYNYSTQKLLYLKIETVNSIRDHLPPTFLKN